MKQRALFWRFETDTPLRIWSGFGPKPVPADAVEIEGARYLGIGLMIELPTLAMLFNGTADRMTLELNGVDQRVVELIDVGAAEVEGIEVHMGVGSLDADLQIESIFWFEGFTIETIDFDITPVEEEAQESHVNKVTISMAYGDGDRRRSSGRYWTPEQARSGDLGFAHVPGLAPQTTRTFPPKGK